MRQPSNLTPEAIEDYRAALRRSQSFGTKTAREMRHRLLVFFDHIASGLALGHQHQAVDFTEPTLCITLRPLLVFYNPRTRIVLRIVDGRRDLPALFAREP